MRFPLLARTWDSLVARAVGRREAVARPRPAGLSVLPLEDRITPTGRPLPQPYIFVGAGSGAPPLVRAYRADTGELAFERQPFASGFAGGVRVSTGDINHDGTPDLIAAAGPGGGPAVKVYDGKTGNLIGGPLGSFYAYDPSFAGGVYATSGDVDGDGVADVITAAGAGGTPHVKVFSGNTGQLIASFYAFDTAFRGGATVASADFNGDGKADLVVGAGAGGGPNVRVFDLSTGEPLMPPLGSFYAFDPSFTGGVDVGTDYLTGDVTGDSVPDIVVGRGPGAGSLVRVFDGKTGNRVREFSPFGAAMTAGVRVATAFVDDDANADIVVGTGAGVVAQVKVFGGLTSAELAGPMSPYTPFGSAFAGGLFVAASNDPDTTLMYGGGGGTTVGARLDLTVELWDGNPYNGYQQPTGTVAFTTTVGGTATSLGTATLAGFATGKSRATLTIPSVSLPAGMYSVLASYSGDAWFLTNSRNNQLMVSSAGSLSSPALRETAPPCDCAAGVVAGSPGGPSNGTLAKAGAVADNGQVSIDLTGGADGDIASSVSGGLARGAVAFTNATGYADAVAKAGTGAVAAGLPRLTQQSGGSKVAMLDGAGSALWFDFVSGGTYTTPFGHPAVLVQNSGTGELELTDGRGATLSFYDFGVGTPAGRAGRLKRRVDAAGNTAQVASWDSAGRATELQMTDAATGAVESLVTAFDSSGYQTSVARRRKVGSGSWSTVRTVEYAYATVSGASDQALVGTTVKDGSGTVLEETYDRYHASGATTGYAGGLKYHLGAKATSRLKAAYSGTALSALTDAQVAEYADVSLEYDATSHRATKVVTAGAGCSACSGGLGTAAVNYSVKSSPGSGINDWTAKVAETLDDGTIKISYANKYGQTLLSVTTEPSTGKTWLSYTKYDSAGRVILQANPSAVTGYDEALTDLVGWSGSSATYLRSADGLIGTTTYGTSTTATSTTAGDVTGYVKSTAIQKGTGGTAVPQSDATYISRTANSQTRYHVAASTQYRNDDGTGGETTTYAYTWQGSTADVASVTTTLPTVTTAQNGPNSAATGTTVFDALGRPIWTKDAAGVLGYTAYDAQTGAVVKSIADANAANTSDFAALPSGWSTPSGAGLHLISTFEVDALGRVTKSTDPLGHVSYTVYNDANHEVRMYAGWDAATNTPTGPTVVMRDDWGKGYSESITMSATPTVSGGRPTGTEGVSGIQSLSRSYRNAAGQTTYSDGYFDPTGVTYSTAANLGTLNTNYYRTEYAYDKQGRQNKTVSAAGTITRTEYDALGRTISTWVGTDDTPTTGYWSTTNLTGTDMVKVSEVEYDGGGVGDSNLTSYTEFPNNGRAARVTQIAYDWRDRAVAAKSGVEASESAAVNRPLAFVTRDNLGEVLTSAVYDGDGVSVTATAPSSSLRRAYTVSSYDEYGRNYKVDDYGVNQTTGALATTPLTSQVWFDLRGLDLKELAPDGQVRKTQYDSLGRPVASYLSDGGGDSTWADAANVTGDTVWAQAEVAYDADSNVLQTTGRDRVSGETGTGALGTPTTGVKARVTYAGSYYDLADRLTAAVDVGTNGGSAWTRPGTVPARSDTALVTSVAYGANGLPLDITDARGLAARTVSDLLGRTTSTTAAYGTADAFTVTNAYDSGGRLASVTAPGSRATQYAYDSLERVSGVTEYAGTAFARTSAFTYDDLGGLIRATDAAGTKTDYAVNALGQTVSVTQAVGTSLARTASIAFDALGRTASVTDPRGNSTGYAYDDIARTATTTDALGYAWTTAFDKAGRVTSQTNPFGKSTTAAYDLPGRVVSVTDALGHATTFQYTVTGSEDRVTDALGNVTKTVFDNFGRTASSVDARGYATAFGYDRNGNVVSVQDASGNLTGYAFDNLNRVTVETDPRGKTTSYAYNATGTVASVTDRLGRVREFTYDAAARRTAETWKQGGVTVQTQTFGYDNLDRLTSATDPDGSYAFTYDALGQTTQAAGPFGVTQDFTYDAAGNRITVTDNQGGSTTSTYDALNRVSTRTQTATGMGTARADWTYTKAGEVATVTRYSDASGTTTVGTSTYGYDDARRLVGIDHKNAGGTSVGTYAYGYDDANRLTSETFNGTTQTYAYDATSQLTSDNGTGFTYDATGNRTNTGYSTSTGNRIASDGVWNYAYDDEGNVTSKTRISDGHYWAYAYDFRNQMTQAVEKTSATGSVVQQVDYAYDTFGNAITRTAGGTTTKYAFEITDVGLGFTASVHTLWAELDGSGTVTARYLTEGEQTLARVTGGSTNWLLADRLGSTRQVTDAAGAVVSQITYTAFGTVASETGTAAQSGNVLFTGGWYDRGTGLYQMHWRSYNPANGQWLSEDQTGFGGKDVNWRRYVGNDPTNGVDRNGLFVIPRIIIIPKSPFDDIIKKLIANQRDPSRIVPVRVKVADYLGAIDSIPNAEDKARSKSQAAAYYLISFLNPERLKATGERDSLLQIYQPRDQEEGYQGSFAVFMRFSVQDATKLTAGQKASFFIQTVKATVKAVDKDGAIIDQGTYYLVEGFKMGNDGKAITIDSHRWEGVKVGVKAKDQDGKIKTVAKMISDIEAEVSLGQYDGKGIAQDYSEYYKSVTKTWDATKVQRTGSVQKYKVAITLNEDGAWTWEDGSLGICTGGLLNKIDPIKK